MTSPTPNPVVQGEETKSVKIRVVVVGGGFAGLDAMKTLRRSAEIEAILIDKKSYHEYLPSVPDLFSEGGNTEEHLILFEGQRNAKKSFKHCKEILQFDLVGKTIKFKNSEDSVVTESFDYAILCTGCDYTTPIKGQATSLEGRVREFEDWRERVAATKLPVLIAGGGHVGVELAADIATKLPHKDLIFATGNGGILSHHSPWQVTYTTRYFSNLPNVKVYQERCKEITGGKGGDGNAREFQMMKSGDKVTTEVFMQCTGFGVPNTSFLTGGAVSTSSKGHVNVDPSTLQVKLNDGTLSGSIFAAGDCITKKSTRRMASFAHFEGEFAARQVIRSARNKELRGYGAIPEKSFAVSLGPRDGFVSVMGRTVMWGRVVPFVKRFVRWGWMVVSPYLVTLGWDGKRVQEEGRGGAEIQGAMV